MTELAKIDGKPMLYALKVGTPPSQEDIETMVRGTDNEEIRTALHAVGNVAHLCLSTVEKAYEAAAKLTDLKSAGMGIGDAVGLFCVMHAGEQLKQSNQMRVGQSLIPEVLWVSGEGDLRREGELFLIAAAWKAN